MRQRKDHLDALAVGILLFCCLFWGFQQILIKATVTEVPPLWQASIRFAIATALLVAWCVWRGVRLFERDGTLWPGLLAGAAIVAATMPAPESFLAPTPAPAPVPVPILLVHGTDDPIVPYQGGRFSAFTRRVFKVDGTALSAPATARYLARRNGITTDPVVTTLAPARPAGRDRTWIEQSDYRQDGRPPVRLLTVHGGGHTVPGPGRAPFFIGRTAHGVSTADVVAEHLGVAVGARRG